MRNNSIGFEIRILSNLLKRRMFGVTPQDGNRMTEMHGMVIDYLYQNREGRDIYQRDIEAQFSIRRSTASGIVCLMEKKGILTRHGVEGDARLKKLELTETAIATHEKIEMEIVEVEAQMSKGISAQDLATYFAVTEKIKQNLGQ